MWYPSSRPCWINSSSSTALTSTCGVISASIFLSWASFFSISGSTWPFMRCRSTATCRCSSSVFVMMSPFTLTSTCSMTSPIAGTGPQLVEESARSVGTTEATANATVDAKISFLIVFNILAYCDALAQIAQKAGHAAEHSAFRPRIFFRRAQDLVPCKAAGHLAGCRARRPPRLLLAGSLDRGPRGGRIRTNSHIEFQRRRRRQLHIFPPLNHLEEPCWIELGLGPEL